MKETKLLFRPCLDTEREWEIAKEHSSCHSSRNDPSLSNSIVIGRYSVLPYYKELEDDLAHIGASLINSYAQHCWVADASNWADLLGPDITPPVFSCENYYKLPEGAYIIKGKTNSRKHKWATHMFAPTRADIGRVVSRLLDDPFVSEQGLIIRPYVKLHSFGEAINSLPITNEWRTFWYKGRYVAGGWYWANHPEFKPEGYIPEMALDIACDAAQKVRDYINFYVIDVALTATGKWIVIELNDGQMSGLADIDVNNFYCKLEEEINTPALVRSLYLCAGDDSEFLLESNRAGKLKQYKLSVDSKFSLTINNTEHGVDFFIDTNQDDLDIFIDTYDKYHRNATDFFIYEEYMENPCIKYTRQEIEVPRPLVLSSILDSLLFVYNLLHKEEK